jgi:hypothetical protein
MLLDIVTVSGIVITVVTGIPVFLQLRNHPRGLVVLFFAEMWERFSYYGMRAILIFYLTEHFLFDDNFAQGQYAAYTTLVYLVPLLGGYLADRWLGSRKAIASCSSPAISPWRSRVRRRPRPSPTRATPTTSGWRAGGRIGGSAWRSRAVAIKLARRPGAASPSKACRPLRPCR